MPEDLKVSQIVSSPLPPPFRGLHSPGVRKHCQIIFSCYFRKLSIAPSQLMKHENGSHRCAPECRLNQSGGDSVELGVIFVYSFLSPHLLGSQSSLVPLRRQLAVLMFRTPSLTNDGLNAELLGAKFVC